MPMTSSNFLPPAATLDISGNAENITRRRFEPPLETSLWLFGIDIITDASGSPGWTRTNDPLINSQMLLPTELQGNIYNLGSLLAS